jgi:hypothetical protein
MTKMNTPEKIAARAGLRLTVLLSGVEGYLIHFSTNQKP